MAKAIVIVCAACATLVVLAPAAYAAGPPPPNPSIAQYIETVPTSGGSAVPASHPHVVKLSKHVVARLPKTPEGAALNSIASSSTYGAPQHRLHVTKRVRRAVVAARRAVMEPKTEVSGATFSAAVDAVGAQKNLVVWLALVLFSTAALGVGAAVARARS